MPEPIHLSDLPPDYRYLPLILSPMWPALRELYHRSQYHRPRERKMDEQETSIVITGCTFAGRGTLRIGDDEIVLYDLPPGVSIKMPNFAGDEPQDFFGYLMTLKAVANAIAENRE
jgi:hypothetical protein